jgi:hypothetical protein
MKNPGMFALAAAAAMLFMLPGSSFARQSTGAASQAPASSQQQQQEQTAARQATVPASKPKAKRVWTEDDLKSLRKGSDESGGQKSTERPPNTAEKSGNAAAAKAGAEQVKPAAIPGGLPEIIAEAQERLAQKQEETQNLTETLARVRRDYLDSVDEGRRTALARKRQELTSDLEAAQAELKVLAARLQELKSKPQKKME